jgi:hypothetical protein
LLAYKRALPMPPASYIGAKICMALLFGVMVRSGDKGNRTVRGHG